MGLECVTVIPHSLNECLGERVCSTADATTAKLETAVRVLRVEWKTEVTAGDGLAFPN